MKTGPKAVWGPNSEALVSTFCVSGSVPRIPRSDQMVEAYGRGVADGFGREKEKGREPTRLERILCSEIKALKIRLHVIARASLGAGDLKTKGLACKVYKTNKGSISERERKKGLFHKRR